MQTLLNTLQQHHHGISSWLFLVCTVLQLWEQVLTLQRLKEHSFVELPGGEGRVSVLDLVNYVKNNPELKALVDKDPNLVLPKEGMTRCATRDQHQQALLSPACQ